MWTGPVVLAVAAAPASAVSETAGVVVDGGTTVVESDGAQFYDVVWSGVTIVPSAPVEPGSLALTVTFAARTPDDEATSPLFKHESDPVGWTGPTLEGQSGASFVYTYGGSVASGVSLVFPDGIYFGTNYPAGSGVGEGAFTLTFSAPGQTPGGFSVDTPGPESEPTSPRLALSRDQNRASR